MTANPSRIKLRYELVSYAKQYGISAAARKFVTTRKTVQLWVRRYDSEQGVESLRNVSRIGQNHPQKLPDTLRQQILAKRIEMKDEMGARRIIELLGLPCSAKTVHKILKQSGRVSKRRTAWKKRMDMSAVRAGYAPFEKLQMDVKYLNDIPACYKAYRRGDIPKFLISTRDYKTGWVFLAFTNRLNHESLSVYARYLLDNLEALGVDLSKVTIQTDNGKEFVDRMLNTETLFQKALRERVQHRVIPPASPRYNSDVESFHGRIESEFLIPEDFSSYPDFMSKVLLYNIYFNMLRTNRNRNNMTPAQIMKQDLPDVKPIQFIIPPILCDDLIDDYTLPEYPVYFNGLPLTVDFRGGFPAEKVRYNPVKRLCDYSIHETGYIGGSIT